MDIERLEAKEAEYREAAEQYRSLAETNYGAAEAIRSLIEELKAEEQNESN